MKSIKIGVVSLFMLISVNGLSQESFDINFSADIVSRFIYRGSDVGGLSPHVQPTLVISKNDFEIGVFGSYGLKNNYSELDLFCAYTYKDVSLTFMNYNIPISKAINGNYNRATTINGNYNRATTINIGELSAKYNGTEQFPSILIAVNLYGDNKQYSTYIEVSQSIKHTGNSSIEVFIGMTPFKSFYADKTALLNVGLKYYRDIEITDDFSLPTHIMLCANPAQKGMHLVFGITL